MSNEHTLNWVNPTTRLDGAAYGQADNAGYEIQLDGAPAVSIPLAYGTSFDLSTLPAFEALTVGPHSVGLSVVDTGGLASSFTTVSFSVVSKSPPMAPTSVTLV